MIWNCPLTPLGEILQKALHVPGMDTVADYTICAFNARIIADCL